jgi:hypothetical protein
MRPVGSDDRAGTTMFFLLQWHGMATREKTTTNERLTKALPGD